MEDAELLKKRQEAIEGAQWGLDYFSEHIDELMAIVDELKPSKRRRDHMLLGCVLFMLTSVAEKMFQEDQLQQKGMP